MIFKIKATLSFQNSISGTKRLWQNSLIRFTPAIIYLGLQLFENTTFDLNNTGFENATNQLTNIMVEAAKRSLKLNRQKNSKRKPITKKWFDYDCKALT